MKYLNKRYAPKWLILIIDLLITTFSVIIAFLLRFNFDLANDGFNRFEAVIVTYLVVRLGSFIGFKAYSGIIRYTSTEDAKRIFMTVLAGNILILFVNIGAFYITGQFLVPLSIFLIEFITTLLLMTSFRLATKISFNQFSKPKNKDRKNVVIYGAGKLGLITKRTIDQENFVRYRVLGFFDDDSEKRDKRLEGAPILHFERDFERFTTKNNISLLIIAVDSLPVEKKRMIIEKCLKHQIQIKIIPSANKWINGELSLNQIKNVNIEDLLERSPIVLDRSKIAQEISDKVILVTGASGSIGSELVRQLIAFKPSKVILFDQSETPLYELELELKENFNFDQFICYVGDVRNKSRVEDVISRYRPTTVFHVAAYKHVPLMEDHPCESIMTNVYGTKTVADLSVKYGVKKFVMISTDKAVNPTNVMGASKRIAEIYAQSLNGYLSNLNGGSYTRFITTRFGNVLGSNGSVIPRFKKQISAGGPITVTHPEISRYFMTIPEACQLILEAEAMGDGGEIFIFDMGKAVKIVDLARKMIRLSGLVPGKDIGVRFTGLRPGEKIREELLNNKENTLPTHHQKIMIASVRKYQFEQVNKHIDELIELARIYDNQALVCKMKEIVPEYKSHNSVYENLDKVTLKVGS